MLTFEAIFRGNAVYLREKLDASGDLLARLLDTGVLTHEQWYAVRQIPNKYERVDELLAILRQRDDALLSSFRDALIGSDQSHIAEVLLPDVDKLITEQKPKTNLSNVENEPIVVESTTAKYEQAFDDVTEVSSLINLSATEQQLREIQPDERTCKEFKSPKLKHVIPSDGRQVLGLTFINNTLFVLRDPSKEEIQVYETATFTQQRTVRVAGLSDTWCYKTLTSCDVNNCLFVSDLWNVYKVDLSADNVTIWVVGGVPIGLSVNEANNVIVACYDENEIREYKPNGQLIRTIILQWPHVAKPFHAVQLNENQFIVSHWEPVHGVSLIDPQGSVCLTYRNSKSTQLFNCIRKLTVAKNGSVLVVDCNNNRLVVLDASLRNARELPLPIDGRLNRPGCLHFNESLSQLFVGEEGAKRVVIYDNICFE